MQMNVTEHARLALESAQEHARIRHQNLVGTEHLLLGMLSVKESQASRILESLDISYESVFRVLNDSMENGTQDGSYRMVFSPRSKNVLEMAGALALRTGRNQVGTEHLLLALCTEPDGYAMQILHQMGRNESQIEKAVWEKMNSFAEGADSPMGYGENNAPENGTEGSALQKYGHDLCQMAKEGKIDPIIGRDEETERVVQILSRRTKNNPCLIGEPGVGKTAVVEGLAQRIVEGRVPDSLNGKRIVTLDLPSMVAGSKYRGEFEERLKNVMKEVAKSKEIILFIDEIHTIIGTGAAEGAVDAANIIKPALARSEMQLIGATTINEYRKYIEKDEAFERRIQPVMVGEPSLEDTIRILDGLKEKFEAHHKVTISEEAIRAAVNLSVRYIGDRYLPDKAIDLIDEAASKKRIAQYRKTPEMEETEKQIQEWNVQKEEAIRKEDYEEAARKRDEIQKAEEKLVFLKQASEEKNRNATVEEEDIADIVTSWTHIPVKKLAEEEGERLIHLEEKLRERVIGQEAAVAAVAKAIRRGRVGLKDPKRPTGSFIFLGPTGVGKTELCKALSQVLFGDDSAMIRLDMSEFMEKHSVSKMIGSPPGYVGYEEGGQLTEQIRRHPYSVILLDEIEKAHPDVFNLLLQILEDGRLTDSQGRTVDFKNAVIIMTSNCGAGHLNATKHFGFVNASDRQPDQAQKEDMLNALKNTFRPEFLNRVDDIIVFEALSDTHITQIASLLLKDVVERVRTQEITLSFEEEVVRYLGKEGFDPMYGARPLRRAIVRLVEDPLSEAMLNGTIQKGDTVQVVLKDKNLEFCVNPKQT